MAFTAKLMNPTPWEAVLDYSANRKIRVPAFGEKDLTLEQMDDFMPNKAGAEAVKEVLNYFGIFLFDSDRPYDNQALEAIKRSRDAKKAQYDAATRNIVDRRSAQGISTNEDALEGTFRAMGLIALREKVEILNRQIKKYEDIIGPERSVRQQLDPTRTVFVMDPPREFPSVAAMEFFLEQNQEIREKHLAFSNKLEKKEHAPTGRSRAAVSTPIRTLGLDEEGNITEEYNEGSV